MFYSFKNVFFTKFPPCRCKTTSAFQPLTAEAWKQLLKGRLNGKRKTFSVDFLRIRNIEYEKLCKKISWLLLKKKALPITAVTEHQVIDHKIHSIRESRRTIPCRV